MKLQLKRTQTVAVCLLLIAFPFISHAAEVTNLNTFTAGTPTKAAEVNTNFDKLREAANDHEARITTIEGNNATQTTNINNLTGTVTSQGNRITLIEQSTSTIPVGTVVAFAGEIIPTGWLPCDGRPLIRNDYKELQAVIGDAWGAGDTLNTFNIPDMRGMFLRGVAAASAADADKESRTAIQSGGNAGNKVGSYQGEATKLPTNKFVTNTTGDHSHLSPTAIPVGGVVEVATASSAGYDYSQTGGNSPPTSTAGVHQHTIDTGGDAETRPKNVYVYWIIKVK